MKYAVALSEFIEAHTKCINIQGRELYLRSVIKLPFNFALRPHTYEPICSKLV